ncbi:MAG TPA: LacI family DNA-binding transcriptional regulator [Treponemataceae bacterium]|nr:LacI family DNA-binding transcriptional regulator [Treponemataceae bacterium]
MATIREIANLAGVSPTTVSNVIHGNFSKVSGKKKELIQKLITELDYTPNVGAMMLAGKTTKIIGVITNYSKKYSSAVLEDPFVAGILDAIEGEIRSRGYYTMLHVAQCNEEVVSLAETWRVSGLLIMGLEPVDCAEILAKSRVPIVFIDCYFNKHYDIGSKKVLPLYHNIGLEDKKGGYVMTKYLISIGHKKIIFVADKDINDTVNILRYKGYLQALEEAGLPVPDCKKILLYRDKTKRDRALNDLCEYWRLEHFSALFFCSDYYAFQAMRFFIEKGIKVPQDISIAGYDDNLFAKHAYPSLTTVHQDIKGRGVAAVKMLDSIIKGKKIETKTEVFPVRLVKRGSTISL